MKLKGFQFNLIFAGVIFILLYLPVMGRPFYFEELKMTSYFHKPEVKPNVLFFDIGSESQPSQWENYKDDYIRLYPPLLFGFYFLWSKACFEDEILMRLPLLLLILLALKRMFEMVKLFWGEDEASLFLLITILFPWWYTYGTTLIPASFGLFLGIISSCLFIERSFQKKPIPLVLHLINLIGIVLLYQYSFLVLAQGLTVLFMKERRQYLTSSLSYVFIFTVLWSFIFLNPNPYYGNPLALLWGKQGYEGLIKLVSVFITGATGA